MITNQVGIEFEFILKHKDKVVFPSKYGFSTDEFVLLGEMRTNPGGNVADTFVNYMATYAKFQNLLQAARENLVHVEEGHTLIDNKLYREAVTSMGVKGVPTCKNIYGTEISDFSDEVIEDGQIKGRWLSAGMHIHFSSSDTDEYDVEEQVYMPVDLPSIMMGDVKLTAESLYRRTESKLKKKLKVSANRITKPVIVDFVKAMDTQFEHLMPTQRLKYRQKGFYEDKKFHGGFEYRSLPYSTSVHENMLTIIKYAFKLLGDL